MVALPVQQGHNCSKGRMQASQGVSQGDIGPDGRPVQIAIEVPGDAKKARLRHAAEEHVNVLAWKDGSAGHQRNS